MEEMIENFKEGRISVDKIIRRLEFEKEKGQDVREDVFKVYDYMQGKMREVLGVILPHYRP